MQAKGFMFYDEEYFGSPEFDDEKCYVSRSARLTGKVILEDDVIVCPQTTLRADEGTPFKVCKGTNIQDSVVFHGLMGKYVEDLEGNKYSILIYSHCTIAHRALIHGPAKIGKMSFVGFDAVVHASTLGRNSFVDFRATIKNSEIGDNCHVGIGAIIKGVVIANNRYVDDGQVVNDQRKADLLPSVPKIISEQDNHFNKEVVDFNKGLRVQYHERRLKLRQKNGFTAEEKLQTMYEQMQEIADLLGYDLTIKKR